MGQMLTQFKLKYNIPETEKVTYSGRLDPLAHGEVLILTGDDVHKKDEFNKHDKIYKFTIMFGVSTDTGDILGMPKKPNFLQKLFAKNPHSFTDSQIKNVAKSFIGHYTQTYPAYSSYNINGVPMWQLARDGKLPKKLPKNNITIHNLEFFKLYTKTSEEVLSECRQKVNSVDGDFRQFLIAEGWANILNKENKKIVNSINENTKSKSNNKEDFVFVDMRATVSAGTYIRILCEDIGKKLKTPALAYSIEREEILLQ